MENVTIEKIKEVLEKNKLIFPGDIKSRFGNIYLADKHDVPLFVGDVVEFKCDAVNNHKGVIMFGKYICWGYGGVPDEFIGFYILPILGTKQIPIDLNIHRQLINGKTKYIGNIYEKEWDYLFENKGGLNE
jgi:hypothetical protein